MTLTLRKSELAECEAFSNKLRIISTTDSFPKYQELFQLTATFSQTEESLN